jgi:hypothetical protein
MSNTQVLADFLATDVQDYRPRIDEINAVLLRQGSGVFIGNGYELILSAKQAVLRHTQARHAPVKIKLGVFKSAFDAWVAALPPS